MALNISGYTDPGVIIGEVVTPAAISIATVPDILCVVATGDRNKRSINEAVIRGQIEQEALTVAGSPPHTATLVNRGDRRVSNTTIRRTLAGNEISIPAAAISYPAAFVTAAAAITTVDVSAGNAKAFGFQMDSGQKITVQLEYDAGATPNPVATATGTLLEIKWDGFSGAAGDAATAAEIVTALNAGLSSAAGGTLGYGVAYASFASQATNILTFTSPLTTYVSDVEVSDPFANDGTTTLGFTTTPAQADTIVEITATYYDASATYEIDYVSVETNTDAVSYTVADILRIGSFPGVTSFLINTDYLLTAGAIDWSPDAAATFTSSIAETFDLSTNDTIKLALDGNAAIEIDLNGLGSPPPGYANPAAPAAATAAEIVNNINAVLSVAAGYGPNYRAVATDVSGVVKLTSPTEGGSSSIEVSAPSATDATQAIFGLTSSQLPYTVIGTGSRPVVGVTYFATYEYARPAADYETPKRFFSEDQMTQDLGPVALNNIVSVYGQVAFENGAPSIFTSQIDDSGTPGSPTVNEVNSAIDAIAQQSLITDVCVADTRLNVQTKLIDHIETQSSPTEANYRSGWFGMPVGTDIGDKDTPDTFVYRSAVTLQVVADSPARGRLLIVAPTGVDRTLTLEDGSETTVNYDSTIVAAAVAARHTSFTSPAISLASKNIIGFDVNTFPVFLKGERAQLAQNGVLVITETGGRLTILDPVTTEVAGGALPQFSYRSTTSQKDNVTRSVSRVIDSNLRGIVPDDLADFIFDIKLLVGQTLTALIDSGAIGPFRDANGVSRDIDLSRDVQAEQNANDPTKFGFRYFYFLRYPALRFEGEFSVDNPFFST